MWQNNTGGKSKTQIIRESYPYRAEYFKHNPGIFGCVWICSQCGKLLIGKENVVIDHIIPLAKGGRNHVSNTTACCQKCNSAKSDIVDGRVVKGYIFKMFESNAFRAQRGVGTAAMLGVGLTTGVLHGTSKVGGAVVKQGSKWGFKAGRSVVRFVTYPLRRGKMSSRLVCLAAYVLLILYFLKTYTNLLDAWM